MAPIITQTSHEHEMKGAFHLVTQLDTNIENNKK